MAFISLLGSLKTLRNLTQEHLVSGMCEYVCVCVLEHAKRCGKHFLFISIFNPQNKPRKGVHYSHSKAEVGKPGEVK